MSMYVRGSPRPRGSAIVGATSAIVLSLVLAVVLSSCGGTGGGLTTSSAWARPGAVGADSAAYMTITNSGSAPDTLVSAASAAAGSVGMHESSQDATGMMGMHPMVGIEIPAGGTVTLAPGGMHLMLTGLTRDLGAGDTVDLDLVFKNAGTVKVKASVTQP